MISFVKKSYVFQYLSPRINALLRMAHITRFGASGYFNAHFAGNSALWQRNKKDLLLFKKNVCEHNGEFLLVQLVDALRLSDTYPYKEAHRALREFCIAHDIPVLDLYEECFGENFTGYRVTLLDAHPSPELHHIFAEKIAHYIISRNIISSRTPSE